jgi:cephalosporin hydroxylase
MKTRLAAIAAGLLAVLLFAGGVYAGLRWAERPDRVRAGFHRLFHRLGVYNNMTWLGVTTQKCPTDMWTFQEILHETRPDVLVEAGTYKGGSAYYFASVFDLLKNGRVITIDIEDYSNRPAHERITYLSGSSTAPETLEKVKGLIRPGERVMVVLDSDHSAAHVARELEMYSPLVTQGLYLVVEDTHFNGNPILPGFGPGPMEALRGFLKKNDNFVTDRYREKFLISFNPEGYLRRVH